MDTSVAMLLATVVLVLVSSVAATATYFTLRSQIDPHVVVYATPDRTRPSIINLIIANVGRGTAYDVRFALSSSIPKDAYGLGEGVKKPATMDAGPLIEGIPALGPGAERVITWGQFHGLQSYLGDDVVKVVANFRSQRHMPWDPTDHAVESRLEVRSFAATDASRSPELRAVDHLKSIATSIQRVSNAIADDRRLDALLERFEERQANKR